MEIKTSATSVLQRCLGVKPGENVLIITDDERIEIGRALYESASALGCEALLFQMAPRELAGQEPPAPIAAAMKAADVVICPTLKSLTHTNARIEAVKAGARVATMPGVVKEMFFQGAMTADYNQVKELTMQVVEMLNTAKTARIVKDGHTLTLSIEGRKGIPSTGVYLEKGESGNLPSGEAYIAPLEDGSDGEMIIDGSMVGIGKLDEPLYMKVENGKLVEIKGKDSEKIGVLLENPRNATLCELGIGTNKSAILCGNILEDEKVWGTVHIAFGTNTSFGGVNKADCHMDGIILAPDLYLDDVQVLAKGRFVI